MIVSTKGRYALRVMVNFAGRPQGAYVPLKEISEEEGTITANEEDFDRIIPEAQKIVKKTEPDCELIVL